MWVRTYNCNWILFFQVKANSKISKPIKTNLVKIKNQRRMLCSFKNNNWSRSKKTLMSLKYTLLMRKIATYQIYKKSSLMQLDSMFKWMKNRKVRKSRTFRRWSRLKRYKNTTYKTIPITWVVIHLLLPWQMKAISTNRKIMKTTINMLRMHMTHFNRLTTALQV